MSYDRALVRCSDEPSARWCLISGYLTRPDIFGFMMKNGTRKPAFVLALFLCLIVACQFSTLYADYCVPVVIWCPNNQSDFDSPKTAADPLQKLPTEEFEKIFSNFGKIDPLIVADDLCIEYFKDNKVLSNATSDSKLFYFPCVDAPYYVFQNRTYKQQIKMITDINKDHELNMILKDADLTTCAALTGIECSYSQSERIKRDVTADNFTDFRIKTDRFLLYSSAAPLFKASEKSQAVSLPGSKAAASSYTDNDGTLVLKITFSGIETIGDLVLEFFFPVKSVGYYTLKRVHYNINGAIDILETKQDIYFPYNFSYHCSLNTVFINKTTYLNITDLQVQIDSKDATFNDAYDCVGFTTIPIWTGIFVTGILALIMIWALTMIMDIRVMDRFDDPKGKTITISTAE